MKSLLLLLVPFWVHAGNNWNVTLPGGGLQFQGVVVAEACRVDTGDKEMMVNMGRISSNRFHHLGEDVNPIPFDIHLKDCNTSVSDLVGVSFIGVSDGKNPDVLSIDEEPGMATGVGIALFDQNEEIIPINHPPLKWRKINSGDTTLNLVAKYRATSKEVTGGTVNAQLWFALTYQ
ncbi:fimbrial protein [Enterobacter sp. M4-VN]